MTRSKKEHKAALNNANQHAFNERKRAAGLVRLTGVYVPIALHSELRAKFNREIAALINPKQEANP